MVTYGTWLNRSLNLYLSFIIVLMRKPVWISILSLIPLTLILLGWYLEIEVLKSIGYVFVIFYFIMIIKERFTRRKN